MPGFSRVLSLILSFYLKYRSFDSSRHGASPRILRMKNGDDNAPVHTAHIIRDWLEENGVWWLPHPAKSPDLNPIKHFWLKLKESIFEMHPELLTMGRGAEARRNALVEAIHEAMAVFNGEAQWDFLAILIESMPRRLAAVRLAGGRQTNYLL